MPILTLKRQPDVPLEAETLSPDVLAGKSPDEVRALPVFLGKRCLRLDDFFDIESSADDVLELHGDLGRVKWIGKAMTRGSIRIYGNAGMHLGAHMKGGSIEVKGNAADWVGGEMTGGLIHVRGNAGGQVGAAYRGSPWGMNRGTILIEGSAGIEVGMRMKRGIITVRGPVRDFAGLQMKGGTLFLMGGAEIRTGAWMIRGTIVCLTPVRLLPTFAYCSSFDPIFLRMYATHLKKFGFAIPTDPAAGSYERHLGDSAVPGKGEILFWRPQAS
ncbi:MAG TPA: formylmethanofuran dehydrogenase subunit C [Gemmataceae bacterium]|jgi:formylmethanofuran dehydrogenase subunit C|nr:formylmethanofuran dehydrogenase subunit C [Gemmataceae bacterium]